MPKIDFTSIHSPDLTQGLGKKTNSQPDFMRLVEDKAKEAYNTIVSSEKITMQHLSGAKIDESQIVDSVNKMFMLMEVASGLRDKVIEAVKQLSNMPI